MHSNHRINLFINLLWKSFRTVSLMNLLLCCSDGTSRAWFLKTVSSFHLLFAIFPFDSAPPADKGFPVMAISSILAASSAASSAAFREAASSLSLRIFSNSAWRAASSSSSSDSSSSDEDTLKVSSSSALSSLQNPPEDVFFGISSLSSYFFRNASSSISFFPSCKRSNLFLPSSSMDGTITRGGRAPSCNVRLFCLSRPNFSSASLIFSREALIRSSRAVMT
mmetsp:Transcript_2763/g.5740  ORF Transcript_2763/g.5740 Transcript_2763/m.5740 type:complete len:223 (+) Transcript_2763:145-813(+)